jgi:protein SCO1/2
MHMAALKRPRPALLALAAVALVAVAGSIALAPPWGRETVSEFGHGDYRLVGTDGSVFTEDSLSGAPSAIFFGFAHCPEVCPTTLMDIATWQDELGPAAEALRVFFVTVDPERDDAEMLGDYVGWVPRAVGLTGPREEIDKAIAAFSVYAERIPLDDGDYTMDHTALVFLFDSDGSFFEPIRYQEELATVLPKLRSLLDG